MAAKTVITLPPPPVPQRDRLALLDLRVNDFTRTASAILAAADEKGEQIKAGVQITEAFTGAEFDIGAQGGWAIDVIAQLLIARGKLPPGTTVDVVK